MSFASLCVLSYQRPAFLRTAVSTLREAGAPFELLIHDDGSKCEISRALIKEYVDERIVSTAILNPPGHNQGQGVALNRMFGMAKGDPIIKLDQDLIFNPGWLARVNDVLYRDPLVGLLGLFKYEHDPVDWRKTEIGRPRDGQHSYHTHICGSGFAVPRDAWEELGPFTEHSDAFAEDWEFQKRVTDSERWKCALPDLDLVSNQGFGIGPSTVVPAAGQVATIHHGPVIHP